jgi:Kef-type K+ transport system membrane component KefB/voltage-gated potassium channel Kch
VVIETVFYELAAIMLVAGFVALAGLLLKQPLIVSFIAAGILVGPAGLGMATSTEVIDLLSELGVALLLFVVGLRLDLRLIQTTGTVALMTGLGQVVFTSVIGFIICLALGMSVIISIYVAVALTFSSTIIIVKLLSDKGELDALHGRIALGFLIVQDMVVVFVMIALSAYGMGATEDTNLAFTVLWMLIKGVLFLGGLALFMRYGARPLLERLAKSQELMVLLAVAYAVALAAVSDYLGFSKEMGAFLAGISLASTPYRDVLSARLVSLRDFLLLFFFIALGTHLDVSTVGASIVPALILSVFVLIGNPLIVIIIMGDGLSQADGLSVRARSRPDQRILADLCSARTVARPYQPGDDGLDVSTVGASIVPALILSVFVLIGNPLIVIIIMGAMGYRKRTGFLSGLAVAQISEFSLIFAALGLSLGHISQETMGLVTLVGIITIGLSTYMILYSQSLYPRLEPLLWPFERKVAFREENEGPDVADHGYDVIVFGLGRFGTNVAQGLRRHGLRILGIDFDPAAVNRWRAWGQDAVYGDARDPEFLALLPLRNDQYVVNAIPTGRAPLTDAEAAVTLVKALRQHNFTGVIAATARDRADVAPLRQAGADVVFLPFVDAARRAVEQIVDVVAPDDPDSRSLRPMPDRTEIGDG